MALPKSVTKIDRQGGVTFTSNVDQINYTITELSRAALRDTAKFIRKLLIIELKKLRGMKRSKRIYTSTQYWNRSKSKDLLIGFKHGSWYGSRSELGTHGSPARGILRTTVYNNIDQIQAIQAQYLSGLNAENPSLAGTSEGDYESPDGAES
ncbi:hypothetical protein [Halalkalibacter flavus]|uniref:hypothetical protein n=1 Tax=Halalkalibacter flavus TaxID=3090668 RepID=UPI002FC643F2